MNNDDVRNFVIAWSIRFPVDRWWRKKHNVAFNSLEHRESSFLDQLIEFEEDKLFQELSEITEYTPNCGDWIKIKGDGSTSSEIQSLINEFEDLKDPEDGG